MVAAITGQTKLPSTPVLNCSTRDTSPLPVPIAHRPMKITISRPVNSTQVSTTLAFTLSPTPRKLTSAQSAMKPSPTMVIPMVVMLRLNACDKLAANARDAVEAEVMPEHITAKATMKVTK